LAACILVTLAEGSQATHHVGHPSGCNIRSLENLGIKAEDPDNPGGAIAGRSQTHMIGNPQIATVPK
jgi:hypothetical protein